MPKSKRAVVRWEDLEYEWNSPNAQESMPPFFRALQQAGVPIREEIVQPARVEERYESEVAWGGSHGVEFESAPLSPHPTRVQIPALYRYAAPKPLMQLDSWRTAADVAVWVAKTFSPGTLGTMYALHEGDWQDYIRELWREAKGKPRDDDGAS